ncbi:hypothetical protein ACFLRH_00640 [Actinomycetota bacterium]
MTGTLRESEADAIAASIRDRIAICELDLTDRVVLNTVHTRELFVAIRLEADEGDDEQRQRTQRELPHTK